MLGLENLTSSLLLNYGPTKRYRPPRINYTIATTLKENIQWLLDFFFRLAF